jgi:16S rRNA (cytosine1402-N4)-methyltransferase
VNKYHTSVLLQEAIDLLDIQKDKKYIDATLGGGGHAREIAKRGGYVLGIDADQDAIDFVTGLKISNLQLAKGNFKDIEEIAKLNNFEDVSGIIFDLGVSSHQFDEAERGFSFQKTGPFDMRMDKDLKIQAKDLINSLTKNELYELLTKLGEEHRAHVIANAIIKARKIRPIETTKQVYDIIKIAIRGQNIDTMARVFQAFRIAINDELNNLKMALPLAFNLLASKGRVVVISFHSLEDRIVKNQFLDWAEEKRGTILTAKPIRPSDEEIKNNKRSRSAKLRALARV